MGANSSTNDYSWKRFIKDLWIFFKKFRGEFIFYSILLALSFALNLVPPLILAKIIDFFTKSYTTITPFYHLLLILLGVSILATILRHISKYSLGVFNYKVQKYAKVKVFERMVQNDLTWHENQNTGEKMQKLNDGKIAIRNFMSFYTNRGIQIIVNLIGIVAVFSFFGIKYSIITLAYLLVYLTFEFRMNKQLSKRTFKTKLAREKASGKSYEFSSNISTIKSLGLEKKAIEQVDLAEKTVYKEGISRGVTSSKKWAGVGIISAIFYAVYLYFIGKDVYTGIVTVGSIVIYVQYIRQIQNSVLGSISNQALNLMEIKQGMQRMMGIYNSLPKIDETDAKRLTTWDKIIFENVSFSYGKKNVLENFNLEIKSGEKIGIVGSSGGGKSTFFKLLLKLYVPNSGKIFYGKRDLLSIKRESLLNRISIVPQETELFNLSLRENIKISKPGRFDKKRYEEALEKSQLTKLVSRLTLKDLTFIGERGVKLSGGERQRLGIARAIYKDSDIIILDEATSNLDYETEKKFQKSIDTLEGKTMIVAAHRLTTLQNMDRIIFLEKGKIVEEGTYEDLIKRQGKFYNLWKAQKH